MAPREVWRIIDQRTGRPATKACFLSKEGAERTIQGWKDRRARGGRPDITAEMLSNFVPAPADAAEVEDMAALVRFARSLGMESSLTERES